MVIDSDSKRICGVRDEWNKLPILGKYQWSELVKEMALSEWRSRWNEKTNKRCLSLVTVDNQWKCKPRMRDHQVLLTQLRLGVTWLKADRHRVKLQQDDKCENCMEPEDIVHYATRCTGVNSAASRLRQLLGLPENLPILLSMNEILNQHAYATVVIGAYENRVKIEKKKLLGRLQE